MNKKHQMSYFLPIALILSLIISCQKESIEQSAIDLTIDGMQKVITVENNGVGIEFCLLNENGEPATIFQEGENFKFHLTIINNVESDTAMYIVSDFLRNPDLFKVIKINGDTIGNPVVWNGMDKIGDASNQIKQGEKWVLEIPWHETRGSEVSFDYHNLIHFLQHYFMGLNQPALSKGRYYTEFTQQFYLGKYLPHPQKELVYTNTLELKINFEIK